MCRSYKKVSGSLEWTGTHLGAVRRRVDAHGEAKLREGPRRIAVAISTVPQRAGNMLNLHTGGSKRENLY